MVAAPQPARSCGSFPASQFMHDLAEHAPFGLHVHGFMSQEGPIKAYSSECKACQQPHGLIDCLNQATGQSLINAVGKMAKSSCIDADIMPFSRGKHCSAPEEYRSMTQALLALKPSKQKVRCPEIVGWLHRKDLPAGALARNNGSSHSLVAKRRSSYQTPEETERTLDMAEHRPSRRLTTAEVQA